MNLFGTFYAHSSFQDILNSILPPREWTQEDQLWVLFHVLREMFLPSMRRSPSHILLCARYSTFPLLRRPACFLDVIPAASDHGINETESVTGADVVNLQEDLDKWLQQRQALRVKSVMQF